LKSDQAKCVTPKNAMGQVGKVSWCFVIFACSGLSIKMVVWC